MERVQAAPEVRDFVFEEAAGEGEDAVQALSNFEKHGVEDVGLGYVHREDGEQRLQLRRLLIRRHVKPPILLPSHTYEKRAVQHRERPHRRKRDAEEPANVELRAHAASKQVAKDSRRVEQRHLLEPQRGDEVERCPERAPADEARYGGEDEAEHDGVVLEMPVVD